MIVCITLDGGIQIFDRQFRSLLVSIHPADYHDVVDIGF